MSGATPPPHPDGRARAAALALALTPGVGCRRFRELAARFGTAEQAFDVAVSGEKRETAIARAAELADDARRADAQLLVLGDAAYPRALDDLPDPPLVLYAHGPLEWLGADAPPVVAIVGTRKATAYGERVTGEIASQLARAGATVISGMARGIDAAAHKGSLSFNCAAVLGTGIDLAYPAAHRALHAELWRRGLLLSEQPPGCKANAGSFPERNRIIAALARLTIVVEAGRRSGALITASRALELNRIVAAVPGPIDFPQNAGSNELLRDGAQVITSAEDALSLAGLTPAARGPGVESFGADQAIWEAVGAGARDLDTIASVTALPAREVMAAVSRLELRGAVECLLTGEIRRR